MATFDVTNDIYHLSLCTSIARSFAWQVELTVLQMVRHQVALWRRLSNHCNDSVFVGGLFWPKHLATDP
jgi:hypothetical protein